MRPDSSMPGDLADAGQAKDLATLTGSPACPANLRRPWPFHGDHVSGIAYAKIIDGMMNIGLLHERATADGLIVAKLIFPGTASRVTRAVIVGQAMLDGALREEAELQGSGRPKPGAIPTKA